MRRVPSVELLDGGTLALDEIHANMDDLWRVNRCFGGVSGNLRLLSGLFRRTRKRRARILDVGAGDGRVAARVCRELRRQSIDADVFVLDRRWVHLQMGNPASARLRPVAADALALPFPEATFDFVTCNLLLHQFSGERALALLQGLASVAREAVLINDLERHWLPYLLVRLAPWFGRHRVSRLDGLASVRQAYTRPELADLAARSGCKHFEIHRAGPFRFGVVLWKAQAPPLSDLAGTEAVTLEPLGEIP